MAPFFVGFCVRTVGTLCPRGYVRIAWTRTKKRRSYDLTVPGFKTANRIATGGYLASDTSLPQSKSSARNRVGTECPPCKGKVEMSAFSKVEMSVLDVKLGSEQTSSSLPLRPLR